MKGLSSCYFRMAFWDGDNFCKAFAGVQVNLSCHEWLSKSFAKIVPIPKNYKPQGRFFLNFVCFSENPNFNILYLLTQVNDFVKVSLPQNSCLHFLFSNLIRILSSAQPIGHMTFMFVLDWPLAVGQLAKRGLHGLAWPNPADFWSEGSFINYVDKTRQVGGPGNVNCMHIFPNNS